MVSKGAWGRYLEIASLVKEADRDEAILMLKIIFGDCIPTSAGSLVFDAEDNLEFWVRDMSPLSTSVEYSHTDVAIKHSTEDLRGALFRQGLLEIG